MIVPRERFKEYAEIPDRVERILFTELAGPISIILPKRKDKVPDYVTSGLKTVSLADGENAFMKRIMEKIEICGTSANISGMPPPSTLHGALEQLGEDLTLAVDGGPSLYRIGHTVIDLASDPPKLIRAGPYHTKKLIELFPELIGEEEGLPDELVKGHSIIDLSPEVDIKATNKGD
jgi:tRNA A37 threonylcarbamoyladenosine synthetase subunit TsaC/SUA5/YrdC